jgi:hypothetical protein
MNKILIILIAEARQDTANVGEKQLNRAKKLLPLTRLMRVLGDGHQITSTEHPCHLCNAPGAMFRFIREVCT